MPSLTGAKRAIIDRLRENWTTTSIAEMNQSQEDQAAVTKTDTNGFSVPWVLIEVSDAGSTQIGIGQPGDQLWLYDGLISVHVFVPVGSGMDLASGYADQIGDIFRARQFYNDTPGFCVRTWAPRTSGGDSSAEEGNWFRVTATIPFEYYHRG